MKTVRARFLLVTLAILLGIVCLSAVVLTAAVFFRSSQSASYREIESLAKPIAELKEVWSDRGELSSLEGVLGKKNQELQAAAADLEKVDRQVLSSRLQTISANLSYLEEVLHHKRSRAAAAVGDLDERVTALENKVGPPMAPEKILEMLFRETGGVFIALLWPLVVLAVFLYLLRSKSAPERLRDLFGGFKSVKLGLAEIVLNDSEKAKARTEDAFAMLRDQAKLQYDLWVQRKSIRQKLEEVVNEAAKQFPNNQLPDYRCTLHVPDIIFEDTLYQLLDYLPGGRNGGRGRVFSVRFGIIGKVWRLFLPETQGEVPQAGSGEDKLIQEWGMTREEAKSAARGRPSFLCIPLKDRTEGPVGMLYMDSSDMHAFRIPGKSDGELHAVILQKCLDNGLIEALAKMKDELSGRAPLIRVYER